MVVEDRVVAQPEAEAVLAPHERGPKGRVFGLLPQTREVLSQLQRHVRRVSRRQRYALAVRHTCARAVLRLAPGTLARAAPVPEREHTLLWPPTPAALRRGPHLGRALIVSAHANR